MKRIYWGEAREFIEFVGFIEFIEFVELAGKLKVVAQRRSRRGRG
jgi:hypothetical protein